MTVVKRNRNKRESLWAGKHKSGQPGPSPLLVIAGLPKLTALSAAATINNKEKRWKSVAGVFPNNDSEIYANDSAITDLLVRTCKFAIAGRRDEAGVTIPSRMVVAYVAAEGSDRLWDGFGHSVWPIPLVHPDWAPMKERHWRFDIHEVNILLKRAIHAAEAETPEEMRLRLEARRTDDVLLLPGSNFHLANHEQLRTRYRAFMRGEISADQIEEEVHVERFAYERLAEFYNRTGGRGKKFAVDQRKLVFAKSQYGQDGAHHDIDPGRQLTQELLRRELEGRFRFGTPLEPPGFQHDVQRELGEPLVRERFDCTINGLVEVSGDHANLFANDVVKGRDVKKVKA